MNNNLIKIDYDNIDVEDIMRQINQNINNRNYSSDDLRILKKDLSISSLEGKFDLTKLEQCVALTNAKCTVQKASVIKSHRRIIGPFIVFFKRLIRKLSYWYVQFLFDQQNEFNISAANSINAIKKYIEQEQETRNKMLDVLSSKIEILTEIVPKIESMERTWQELKQAYQELYNASQETHKACQELYDASQELKIAYQELYNDNQRCRTAYQELVNANQELRDDLRNLSGNIQENKVVDKLNSLMKMIDEYRRIEEITAARMRRIEQYIKSGDNSPSGLVKDSSPSNVPEVIDMDYFLFEEKYRGSRSEIKDRQRIYLDYYRGKSNVLDIGCGRGEFVELLVENNINCTGIDLNLDNINYCKDRGLPVIYADALEYLQSCEDASLDGIFMAQVAEHLNPNDLIKLIQIARKKLKTGSYFIAETINPQSLIVFAESFYMDPSHIKPVHPLTLKFLFETEGYVDIEVKYLLPVSEDVKIPKLECLNDVSNIEKFNAAISHLNNLIYGYRDYAIVAKR